MLMGERTFSSEKYRWGFNGQERDDEVSGNGNSNSAEFWQYDGRLGRRWNVDPVEKPNFSSYGAFSNNPLVFIDPEGNTDYYNSSGKWIGTDGNTNGINAMVTHSKVERKISRVSKKGKNFKAELPNGAFFKLPGNEVLMATVKVFEEQGKPHGIDESGGLHEVATFFDCNGLQSDYLHGDDVLDADDVKRGDNHVMGHETPAGFESGLVSIHSHPTRTVIYPNIIGGDHYFGSDASNPSKFDKDVFKLYDLNIIVGKTGLPKTEQIQENFGNMTRTYYKESFRPDNAHFFNSNSDHLFSASIDSLSKISSGDGRRESKKFNKYERKRNK
jgi:RHS repeat-associated protein